MTQAESKQKIEGRFYPLQHSEWLTSCRELTLAERNVLYYIRTLNPEGSHTSPRATEIAKMLGLDKATVSRALTVPGQRGYIGYPPIFKNNIEQLVRDHLHTELSGLKEVNTPAGLQRTSATMRIHLFGRNGEMFIATAVTKEDKEIGRLGEIGGPIRVTLKEVG